MICILNTSLHIIVVIAERLHPLRVLPSLDSRRDGILIMFDLSAAFDTIDCDILLNRPDSRFGMVLKIGVFPNISELVHGVYG